MSETQKQSMIYVRSSTVGEPAANMLALQERQCRAFAEAAGYKVAQVFKDEGFPGGMEDPRPALGAMFETLMYTKEPHAVVVLDRDRLARDRRDWPSVVSTFNDLKAELLIVSEGGKPLPVLPRSLEDYEQEIFGAEALPHVANGNEEN